MKSFSLGYLLVTIALVFFGCNSGEDTIFEPKNKNAKLSTDPITINVALNDTYCKKTACSCIYDVATRNYEDVQKILREKYNIDLKITYYIEPYDLEDAIKSKKYDGIITKPWTAFMYSKEYKFNFKRIADILDPNNNANLEGLFMVKKESSIKTLDQISGKVLVCGQKDAYEKYHSPYRLMRDKNIKPSEIINKASCLECINYLIDKKAEVAIVSDYVMTASCAVDIAKPEDFRIIGRTEKMPLCSVILDMNKVSENKALRLQKALIEISGDKSPESMISKGFVKPMSWKPKEFINENE